jgi:threonine/homoserine/homoserine lactone efflux protein
MDKWWLDPPGHTAWSEWSAGRISFRGREGQRVPVPHPFRLAAKAALRAAATAYSGRVPAQLLPFLVVVGVLTVTPGPDMALVLRNGMRGGVPVAWWTGLGCCSGIAVHATAAVIGLSALLAASATAFTVVKLVGAAYLVYLGLSALWHSRRNPGAPQAAAGLAPVTVGRGTAFRQGMVSNLLNPKIALIFLSLIPQFVSPGEPAFATTAVLAAVFLGLALLWWRLFSFAVAGLGRLLSRPRVRTAFERATGAVLIGLGARVALTDH